MLREWLWRLKAVIRGWEQCPESIKLIDLEYDGRSSDWRNGHPKGTLVISLLFRRGRAQFMCI